jgi:hypothetical protein
MEVERVYGNMEMRKTEGILIGGSLAETVAGIGAIVLSILALLGFLTDILLAVSVIAIGGSFLMTSSSMVSQFTGLIRQKTRTTFEVGGMAVGLAVMFSTGVGGTALGVLSLLGMVPNILLPIAAIGYGFALLFGLGVQSRLSDLEMQCGVHHDIGRVARQVSFAGSGIHVLFGLGAMTLGVLSLVGIAPVMLTLIAMLAVGGATLFSGAVVSERMWEFNKYCEFSPLATGS